MSQRGRLLARQLPRETVTLPPPFDGGDPEPIELRALPPGEWDALVELHPPTPEQAERGFMWNEATFRPALLAASVVTPAGEEDDALSEQDWAELAATGGIPMGDLNAVYAVAVALNDRSPLLSVGKG